MDKFIRLGLFFFRLYQLHICTKRKVHCRPSRKTLSINITVQNCVKYSFTSHWPGWPLVLKWKQCYRKMTSVWSGNLLVWSNWNHPLHIVSPKTLFGSSLIAAPWLCSKSIGLNKCFLRVCKRTLRKTARLSDPAPAPHWCNSLLICSQMHLKHEVTVVDYSPLSLCDPSIYLLSSLATCIFFSLHLADASTLLFPITQQQQLCFRQQRWRVLLTRLPGKSAIEVTLDVCGS